MSNTETYPDANSLAEAVAEKSIAVMQSAISRNDSCVWVLAGGSTPVLAYQAIANNHLTDIDWSKVTILIGDERIARLDSEDSNWHQAEQALLHCIPQAKLLRPSSDQPLAIAVDDYCLTLEQLPSDSDGRPLFDLVWLGVGEDGHTLSLFPNSPLLDNTSDLVLAIEDSPKPPSQRLTFGLGALKATNNLMIIAAGSAKADAIAKALSGHQLPVARAAKVVEQSGGQVDWMIDAAAGSRL